MCTVDLSDAFFHVPISERHRKYFQFRFEGQTYQFRGLPFGWSRSPHWFQLFTGHVTALCRQLGFRISVYLDDFLVMAETEAMARTRTQILCKLLQHFGFTVNDKKSELEPSRSREFLGVLINSVEMSLSVPRKKLAAYVSFVKRVLRRASSGSNVTLVELQSLVGKLSSCSMCFSNARIHLNELFLVLKNTMAGRPEWTEGALRELRWWAEFAHKWNGAGFKTPTPKFVFTTDASPWGWSDHRTLTATRTHTNRSPLSHFFAGEVGHDIGASYSRLKGSSRSWRISTQRT